jgi:hypothetical protein
MIDGGFGVAVSSEVGSFMKLCILSINVAACAVMFAQHQSNTDINSKLSTKPFDTTILGAVRESGDQAFLPALRKAFAQNEPKLTKQAIAVTVVMLGDSDPQYFDYLAGFALEAVRSSAPNIFLYDVHGNAVRGKMSYEFEEWCRVRAIDPKDEAGRQLSVYPSDLLEFAETQDQRAVAILWEGLQSQNPVLVAIAARGVAAMQDSPSIGKIIAASHRFSTKDGRHAFATALAIYNGEVAQREILQQIEDPALKDEYLAVRSRQRRAQPRQ